MRSDLNSSNIQIASQNIEGGKGLGTNLSLKKIIGRFKLSVKVYTF